MLVLMVCLLTSPAGWAYKKLACEIEDENTVSYVVADGATLFNTGHRVLFVKRVDNSGNEEYWLREWVNTEEDRFLYYTSIVIDGNEYCLKAIKEPRYYHIVTGESVIEAGYLPLPKAYYFVPKEVINKIKDTNNDIVLIMNRLDKQNLKMVWRDKFKQDIQKMISLTYKDKDLYWKPNAAN